jgi:hypothetical protein
MSDHEPRGSGTRDEDALFRAAWIGNRQFKTLSLKPWQVWLGGGLALALGLGLALLATGILLIAVPIALIAGGLWRLFGRSSAQRSPQQDGIIDADYRVIESPRLADHTARKPREN